MNTKTSEETIRFNLKVGVSVVIAVLLALASLQSCSPNRHGCPGSRNFSGYSSTQVEQNCAPIEWEVLKQALIDEKKQKYDAVADLNTKAIPGYTLIGSSNVEYIDGERVINDRAMNYFYRDEILFPKCAVSWCHNVSAYSYLDGSNCCCDNHSEN